MAVLVGGHPTKDEWKCAGTKPGALCATMGGASMMPEWPVISWDSHQKVSNQFIIRMPPLHAVNYVGLTGS